MRNEIRSRILEERKNVTSSVRTFEKSFSKKSKITKSDIKGILRGNPKLRDEAAAELMDYLKESGFIEIFKNKYSDVEAAMAAFERRLPEFIMDYDGEYREIGEMLATAAYEKGMEDPRIKNFKRTSVIERFFSEAKESKSSRDSRKKMRESLDVSTCSDVYKNFFEKLCHDLEIDNSGYDSSLIVYDDEDMCGFTYSDQGGTLLVRINPSSHKWSYVSRDADPEENEGTITGKGVGLNNLIDSLFRSDISMFSNGDVKAEDYKVPAFLEESC